MTTSEELWGDSPSGLAANAPFRSDSKVDLFIRVLANCLAAACISQAAAKELFIFSIAIGKFLIATNRKFFSKILQMIVKQKF